MPQICLTLPKKDIDELKLVSQKTQTSFSSAAKEIIELGLKVHKMQHAEQAKIGNNENQEEVLATKMPELTLCIMNVLAETYRVLRGGILKFNIQDPEKALEMIKNEVHSYVKGIKGEDA